MSNIRDGLSAKSDVFSAEFDLDAGAGVRLNDKFRWSKNTEPPADRRFAACERRLSLAEPGIGPQVVERLERQGIHSLSQLQRTGLVVTVLAVCSAVGSIGWANRRKPLQRALGRLAGLEDAAHAD